MMEASRFGPLPGGRDQSLWGWSARFLNASRTGHGQEPARRGCRRRDQRPAAFATVRPDHADRWDGLDRRPGQPAPAARTRTCQGEDQKVRLKGTKTEIPLEGNIGLPGEPSKFKTPKQERAEDEADDDDWQGEDPPAPGSRGPRLHREAIQHQDHRVLRGHPPGRGRPAGAGSRLCPGVRVLSQGQESATPTGPDWTTTSTACSSPREARRLLAGDHERGLRLLRELLGRNRGFPGLLDRLAIGLLRLDRPGPRAGQVRQGTPLPPRTGGDGPRAPGRPRHAQPLHRPGQQAGQGRRVTERARAPGCPGRRPPHLANA